MPLASPLLDYTDKDFDALRFRLRNLVRSVFPEWTDFNAANFGNILLELFAHTGDILTFYQDNQARQSRIVTATQRKAIIGLVKLIGYSPSTATAATADVTITLPTPPVGTVTWPAGTVLKTLEVTTPVAFQLLEPAVISAGANPATVTVSAENSEGRSETYTTTSLPNQSISLASLPYIDGSAVVVAANGTYTLVDNFLDSTPTDRHYTITVDQNDRATIKFGNGVNAAVPVGTIAIDYKIGGGSAGRVEQNTIRSFEQTTWTDSLGNPVSPSVTNAAPSSGGNDRQSVDQIKQRAPASLRVLTRSVAKEDFEINALRLVDVARALMLTKNEDVSVAENTGELYIVPVGGGVPSLALKAAVLAQVTTVYPCTITFDPQVKDPVYFDVNVFAVVYLRAGANAATVGAAVRASLTAFFAVQNEDGTDNANVDFGANIRNADGDVTAELALSDVQNVVRDTTGIRKIGASTADFTLNDAHADVVLASRAFPRLGTVTLLNGDSGQPI